MSAKDATDSGKLLSDPLELSAREKPYGKVWSQSDQRNEGKVPKEGIVPDDCMMLFYIVSIFLQTLLYMQRTAVMKCSLNKRFFVFSQRKQRGRLKP